MGQYYNPTILNERNKPMLWMYSHDYGNGLKLMEHSWIGNDFVERFEALLTPEGKYHMAPVVWAGDYADPEADEPIVKETYNGRETESQSNIYDLCEDRLKRKPRKRITADEYPFLVNHDKKQYVDKRKSLPITASWAQPDDFRIHPLPLLTCEGNGRGGGDFHGEDPNGLVGAWARDRISVEREAPEGFAELIFDLIEE